MKGQLHKSNRLIRTSKFFEYFFKVKILGEENIGLIPQGKGVVFAPSHLTDFDVPITVASIGRFRQNLKVGHVSSHNSFFGNPTAFISLKIAGGKKNFRPIYHTGKGRGRTGDFKKWVCSESFHQMEKDINENADVVISAYFDSSYSNNRKVLSNKKGVGAVYLAQQTSTLIVPIAVDVQTQGNIGLGNFSPIEYIKELKINKWKKPIINISIGKPIQLEKIAGIKDMTEVIKNNDLEKYSELRKKLENKSEIIMNHIAEILPKHKHGNWN